MIINEHTFMLETTTRLHKSLYISGWFSSKSESLADVGLREESNFLAVSSEVSASNERINFSIQVLMNEPYNLKEDLFILFSFQSGIQESISLAELMQERILLYPSTSKYANFSEKIRGHKGARVLDLGGRDRSQKDRSLEFPNVDFTVFDIVPSVNVDVVGDAHKLSQYFPRNHFDYVVSLSVFEHLAMPWKVALEMNKVMKTGGQAFINAPQSIGMHDLPWDFWRFSDVAWDSIFNKFSGFRIVDRARDYENFILPFILREIQLDAEKSAGFENTVVVAEKISKSKLRWNVDPDRVISGEYPRN